MTATLLVGDAHERMWELPDHSFDLIITSPPFPWLRSYLPDDHPQKHLEIGREASPAKFMDVMLRLTAEWRRLLTPTGSLAVEFGDVYAGSGGAGGDYDDDGMRAGQSRFRMIDWSKSGVLTKSLCGIPHAYMLSLVLGYNVYDRRGPDSPAGRWLVRNYKSWFRTNPPVGALGDKERPATSYITVACTSRDRYFDLDSVRTLNPSVDEDPGGYRMVSGKPTHDAGPREQNAGGAPPLDWWHQTDAVIDRVLNDRAGKRLGGGPAYTGNRHAPRERDPIRDQPIDRGAETVGARGVHIRRALQDAGILPPHPDALDISPRGYSGAHYAVWPPELVRQLVDEMCPRRVCTVCGEPSRRIHDLNPEYNGRAGGPTHNNDQQGASLQGFSHVAYPPTKFTPAGWSDCGHGDTWRPGRVLDPFSGSGTTLATATGMGRDAVGIDLDPRNATLTEQRCGMFLTIDWGTHEPAPGRVQAKSKYEAFDNAVIRRNPDDHVTHPERYGRRPVVDVPGQAGLFEPTLTAPTTENQ